MARGTLKNGFDPTRFVKINEDHANDNKSNDKRNDIIEKIKAQPDDKLKMYIYLERENGLKVKEYGKQIGKAAGGNSRIVNEALREFFKKHNL